MTTTQNSKSYADTVDTRTVGRFTYVTWDTPSGRAVGSKTFRDATDTEVNDFMDKKRKALAKAYDK